MHIHVGIIEAIVFLAYLLIVGFFLRTLSAKYHDSPFGKALAFVY